MLNVNQFALPGMEEHAHAGAKHLAEGYRFEYGKDQQRGSVYEGHHRLRALKGQETLAASKLHWLPSEHPDIDDDWHKPGEISGVRTSYGHERRGLASALYGMATDPNVYTGDDTVPLHSETRTPAGYRWSRAVGGWDPEVNDPEDRPQHPYEARGVDQRAHRPMRGQQQMFSVGRDD